MSWFGIEKKEVKEEEEEIRVGPYGPFSRRLHEYVRTAKDSFDFWKKAWGDNEILHDITYRTYPNIEYADLVKKIPVTDSHGVTHERTVLGLLAEEVAHGRVATFAQVWKTYASRFRWGHTTPIFDSLLAARKSWPDIPINVIIHFKDRITYADTKFIQGMISLLQEVSYLDYLESVWEIFVNILKKAEKTQSFLEQEKKDHYSNIIKMMLNFATNAIDRRKRKLFFSAVDLFGVACFDHTFGASQVIEDYTPELPLNGSDTFPDVLTPKIQADKCAFIHQLLIHCLNGFPDPLDCVLEKTHWQWISSVAEVICERLTIEDVYNSFKKIKHPNEALITWWMRMLAILSTAQQLLLEVEKKFTGSEFHELAIFRRDLLKGLIDLFSRGVKDPFVNYWDTYKKQFDDPNCVFERFLDVALDIRDKNARKVAIHFIAYIYLFDTFPEKLPVVERVQPILEETPLSSRGCLLELQTLKQEIAEEKKREQEVELLEKQTALLFLGPSAAATLPEGQAKEEEAKEEKEEKEENEEEKGEKALGDELKIGSTFQGLSL